MVTVVPLTSVKDTTNIDNLYPGNVFLSDEVYQKLSDKCLRARDEAIKHAIYIKGELKKAHEAENNSYPPKENFEEWKKYTISELEKYEVAKKNFDEIQKRLGAMKHGSIALVGQLRTISKIRIYEPKTGKDPLSNIRLSNESLDKIDLEINKLFTNYTKSEE